MTVYVVKVVLYCKNRFRERQPHWNDSGWGSTEGILM